MTTNQDGKELSGKGFNEQSLRKAIAERWGEYGAHIDVFDSLLNKVKDATSCIASNIPYPSLKGEAATSCRWVKCSERLPEFLKEVVVKFNDIDAGLGFFTENQDWETGEKILIFRHTNSDNEDVRCDSLTIEWLEELPHPTESRGDSKDIPEELSKEDIWRKWQSDKKALIRCMEALIKLGVKTDDDLQAVLASTPTQEAATSKGWIDVKDRKQYISSIIKPQ